MCEAYVCTVRDVVDVVCGVVGCNVSHWCFCGALHAVVCYMLLSVTCCCLLHPVIHST